MALLRSVATVGSLHAGEPRLRLYPRHPDRGDPRRRAGRRRVLCRAAPAQSVPQPVRRGRVQRRLRAARRRRRWPRAASRRPAPSPRKPSRCCSRCCSPLSCSAKSSCPWLMGVIAPGFGDEPGKFELAVDLTRITFPYLLFISLTALQGGLLNSVDRFAAAGGDADPAQPVPDRRAAADGAVRLARRPGAGLGADRRRARAIPLADGLVRAGRGGAAAAPAAPDAARQADAARSWGRACSAPA